MTSARLRSISCLPSFHSAAHEPIFLRLHDANRDFGRPKQRATRRARRPFPRNVTPKFGIWGKVEPSSVPGTRAPVPGYPCTNSYAGISSNGSQNSLRGTRISSSAFVAYLTTGPEREMIPMITIVASQPLYPGRYSYRDPGHTVFPTMLALT
eukprot:1124740-Rhodomonas_salina.1